MKKRPLIIANWKMNPQTIGEAKKLLLSVRSRLSKMKNARIVIAPPSLFLAELRKFVSGKRISFAAQDAFWEKSGPHTGEISVLQLASLGADHVILGHSERRARGETDDDVEKKVSAVVRAKLTVVLCVGEGERDSQGKYLGGVEEQIRTGLRSIAKKDLARLVIAYEPVWAISTGDGRGETATPEYAHEMKLFIQKTLVSLYGRKSALSVPIIYGGSVNSSNIAALVGGSEADGYLVGGASLDPNEFAKIVTIAHGGSSL